MFDLLDIIGKYFQSLDWKYILSAVLLCEFFTKDERVKNWGLIGKWMISVTKAYRVFILSMVYAALLFVLRSQHKADVETYLHSAIFAMVFYELIFRYVFEFISRINPSWVKQSDHES